MSKPVTMDKLHKKQGGPFPAVYPESKKATNRVRVWVPRYGADLMIGRLVKGSPVDSKSLGTRDPKEAEAAAWALVDGLAVKAAAVKEEKTKATGPLRLRRLISAYLASAEHASLSARRRKEKETMLERWEEFLGRARLVEDITRDDVKRYQLGRRKKVKQHTVYNEWSALRSVVNWALSENMLRLNPFLDISVATEKNPNQPIVTHSEFLALRNKSRGTVPLGVRVYLTLVEATGRREMAVASLKWEDVDLEGESITWPEDTDKEGVRWSDVPISRRAARLLRMWRRHSEGTWVFQSPKGEPYSKSAVDQWMRDLYAAAGVAKQKGSGWHAFRRKFATDAMKAGASMKDVMELGGWKSEAAFMRYVRPDKTAQRAIVNRRRVRVHLRAA